MLKKDVTFFKQTGLISLALSQDGSIRTSTNDEVIAAVEIKRLLFITVSLIIICANVLRRCLG